MSDFKTKMYQIQFRLGSAPDPAGGAYSAPPDTLAGLRGPTSKGRGREGKGEGEERGRKGEGWGRDPTPSRPLIHISGYVPGRGWWNDQLIVQMQSLEHTVTIFVCSSGAGHTMKMTAAQTSGGISWSEVKW